ncbi:hypothetical protein [Escherichia coli]|uniref:Uncharacterized protein n=3 Tax=Asteriusvirus PBECO4 TaxID=2560463 RepID=A0A1C3S707_9CAUD|nr:hypothetical protein [Escherichia coli]YP_009150411.1 protease [Escherichia phage PBECO4]MED6536372.1 hypothetical protein [Escherichia coli O157]QBO61942.1 hypothetical protein G17_00453 [Escherichia phage vB_EcoM_G17]QDF13970.1 hypothetical protein vBEcoMphAPEC6_gp346c [Escherichia phage vB_EcoM_phAPEC6]QXN76189.1 hypothetical protein [Escherichia phage BF17]WIL00724.1 nudix hydrolase [Escherichia phage vB_EcoM_CRJP21]WNN14769.1 hypothetical protein Sharanji_gp488 [Escherichia phage Sha
MKRLWLEVIQAAMFLLLINFPASAGIESKNVIKYNPETRNVYFISDITDGSLKRMIELYDKEHYDTITITSPGGDFDAGIRMANFVRDNGINLIVSRYCNSACTVVFFSVSPEKRYMTNRSVLGLHNISIKSNVTDGDNSFVSVRQLSTFTEEMATKVGFLFSLYAANGIPPEVLFRVSRSRGEDVVILTKPELVFYGSVKQ